MNNFFDRRNFIKCGLVVLGGISILSISEIMRGDDRNDFKNKLKEDINRNNELKDEKFNKDEKEKGKIDKEEEQMQVNGIPYRSLGKTGMKVSLFGLGSGAGAIALEDGASRDDAYGLINSSIDEGVNYIDTAPTYAGGVSEENIGEVMKHRRDEVILATKTQSRDYDGVMRDIERSLNRLKTERIDIYQLHGLSDRNDVNSILEGNGALKALEELKEGKVIKYTGVTGHKEPGVLLSAINEYEFDCLLMPLNTGDIHSKPFQDELLDRAVKKEMGIIAMKVAAYGRLIREDGISSMKKALDYVYYFPISTAIVGVSNQKQLKENLEITRKHEKLSDDELKELENLTAHYKYDANFFKFEW